MASIKFHREFSNASKKNKSFEVQDDQIIAKELSYLKISRYSGSDFFILELKDHVLATIRKNLFKNSQTAPSSQDLTIKDVALKKTSGNEESLQERLRKIRNELETNRMSFKNSKNKIMDDLKNIRMHITQSVDTKNIPSSILNQFTKSVKEIYDENEDKKQDFPADFKTPKPGNINPVTGVMQSEQDLFIKYIGPLYILKNAPLVEKMCVMHIIHGKDKDVPKMTQAELKVFLVSGDETVRKNLYNFYLAYLENKKEEEVWRNKFDKEFVKLGEVFDKIIFKINEYHCFDSVGKIEVANIPLNNFEYPLTFDKDYPYFCSSVIMDLYSFLKDFTSFIYMIKFGKKHVFIKKNLNIQNEENDAKIMDNSTFFEELVKNDKTGNSSDTKKLIDDFMDMLVLSLPDQKKSISDFIEFVEDDEKNTDFDSFLPDTVRSPTFFGQIIQSLNYYFKTYDEILSLIQKFKFNAAIIQRMISNTVKKITSGPSYIKKREDYDILYTMYENTIKRSKTVRELSLSLNNFLEKVRVETEKKSLWGKTLHLLLGGFSAQIKTYAKRINDGEQIDDNILMNFNNVVRDKIVQFFDYCEEKNALRQKFYSLDYASTENISDVLYTGNDNLLIANIVGVGKNANQQKIDYFRSITQTSSNFKSFINYGTDEIDNNLKRECEEKKYPFYNRYGNPFEELPNIAPIAQPYKEKTENYFDLYPSLVRLHETVVHGNHSEKIFVEDLPDDYKYEYSITVNRGYSGALSNEVENTKKGYVDKQGFSLGAYFISESDLGYKFYDVASGKYGKIEIKEGTTGEATKYRKKRGKQNLHFIPYFNFVAFLKQDKFYFKTIITRSNKMIESIELSKYGGSVDSIPSKNNKISEILSHSYDYKERHRGHIYSVVYTTDNGEMTLIAFDKKNIYKLEYDGKNFSSDDNKSFLDSYTTEALKFCANITKINISQKMREEDENDRSNSLHSENLFISVSVSKPSDVFYNKNTKFPYDVRIVASNIFPYLPIIGLHQSQITAPPPDVHDKSGKAIYIIHRDPIWVEKFVDIVHGKYENRNRYYKYRTVEVHDTEYFNFRHGKMSRDLTSTSNVRKTGAFLIYSTPLEYTTDILSLGKVDSELNNGLSVEEMAKYFYNALENNSSEPFKSKGGYITNIHEFDKTNIMNSYPTNAIILKTLSEKQSFSKLCPEKNTPKENEEICRKLLKIISYSIFAKMSTYSMTKYNLSLESYKEERFYDFFYAMNAPEINHTPFVYSSLVDKEHNPGKKIIEAKINGTRFIFTSSNSSENGEFRKDMNIQIGTLSVSGSTKEKKENFTVLTEITTVQHDEENKTTKKYSFKFSDLEHYFPDLYSAFLKNNGKNLTRKNIPMGATEGENGNIYVNVPHTEIQLKGEIYKNREIVLDAEQRDLLKLVIYGLEKTNTFENINNLKNLPQEIKDNRLLDKEYTVKRDISKNIILKEFLFHSVIKGNYEPNLFTDPVTKKQYTINDMLELYIGLSENEEKVTISSSLITSVGLIKIQEDLSKVIYEDSLLNDKNGKPREYVIKYPISRWEIVKKEEHIILENIDEREIDYFYQIDSVTLTFIEKILNIPDLIRTLNYDYVNSANQNGKGGIGPRTGNYLKSVLNGYNFSTPGGVKAAKELYGFLKMIGINVNDTNKENDKIVVNNSKINKSKTFVSYREVDVDSFF